MMLPERTSSAHVARAFQRFARGAVVGLALGVLAACGGGGGSSTPAKTTPTPTPEMTITPVQALTAAQLEAATVISAGETVNGTLESADDVKYYRLDVAETSVVELTLDAEAGTEVALMHRNGVVLTGGITASEITPTGVVVPGGGPPLYVRVREKVGQLEEAAPAVVRKVRRTFSLVSKVEKVAKWAGAVINIVRGIPKVDVPIGVGEVNVDLTGVFQRSDNGGVAFRVGGSTGALAVHLSKTRIESTDEKISATVRADGSAMPGDVELTLCASPLLALVAPAPIAVGILKRTNPLACTPWTIPLVKALPRVKPEYADGVTASVVSGNEYTSRDLSEYFDNPLDEDLSFSVAHSGGSIEYRQHSSFGSRWSWGLSSGERLRVSSGAFMAPDREIRVLLTARNSAGSASLGFAITSAQPPSSSSPVYACFEQDSSVRADPTYPQRESAEDDCTDYYYPGHSDLGSGACGSGERRISQCPRSGGKYTTISRCRIGSVDFYYYYYGQSSLNQEGRISFLRGTLCPRWGGRYTRLK